MARPVRQPGRLRRILPAGQVLDPRTYELRHGFMVWLLWLHIPFLGGIGLVQGETLSHVATEMLLLAVPGVIATQLRSRSGKAMAVSFGLLSSSGILVHFTDGLIESHFHFFVMVTVVALYQDWKPLVLGVGYVALQHGVVGVMAPESVYNHPAALANPVKWAFVHAGYILFLVVVQLSHWRMAEKAQGERRASDERFRRSFEEAPIGMALIDGQQRFLQVNRSLCRMLGYSADQLVGTALTSLTHSDDHATLADARAQLDNGDDSAQAELRCLTTSGPTIWGRFAFSTLPATGPGAATTVVQIEDDTQSHDDRQRLEDLSRGKNAFVASVGDELKGPVNLLLDMVGELGRHDGGLTASETSGFSDRLGHQIREIANVVEDLTVSARTEVNPVSIVPRVIELSGLIGDVLAEVPGGGTVEAGQVEGRIWADPVRARQILRSLLTNAVRYGGPKIEVTSSYSGPDTLIAVADDGAEIPAPEHERIFNADLGHGSPVTQPTSVGLGLTVARYLSRQMGGELTYRRSQDDRSVFEIRLPTEPSQAPFHVPAPAQPAAAVN